MILADGEQTDDAALAPVPKKKTDVVGEIKSISLLILAVLAFHSLIAKPFYIPSESMMPGLLTGDRLVVTKYPYGWSYVSPTFHILPFTKGRVLGRMPERGDVVIVKPIDAPSDYIKRVIGLPGDRFEMRGGVVILNGVPVKRAPMRLARVPVDANSPCDPLVYPGARRDLPDGRQVCELPVYRETLPNGVSYDTIDSGYIPEDDVAPFTIPADHLFLMGDNRDHSADSRFSELRQGLGGPVPWETIGGRAEFITFSLDGSGQWWNPISWIGALRSGRAFTSLHPSKDG